MLDYQFIGLHTNDSGYGICSIQSRTNAYHIRALNIIEGGPHLQTRFYPTLNTPRRCLIALKYGQLFLYTLSLQTTIILCKTVYEIAFSFEYGKVISLRLAGAALKRVS